MFGINRCVVYDILGKAAAGDLRDRSRVSKHQANGRPPEEEQKVMRNHKALSQEQRIHLDRWGTRNYGWGALDVTSRFKLIANWWERSWTNGLGFYLRVISWREAHGVTAQIVFPVDNGEELGSKSWVKVKELSKLLTDLGCRLIQNRTGHPEENAHLERSHRTDDDEFCRLGALTFHSE